MSSRIILVGYMGAGKTTIGKCLSHLLNIPFYDLDWYIEEKQGKTISDIFAKEGESRFREIERDMLREVCEKDNVIIAVGGGTPCFFDNMDYMNSCAETIYLEASVETLYVHVNMGKSQRPLLNGMNEQQMKDFMKQNIAKREPFYTKAKHTQHVDTLYTEEQIKEIAKKISLFL